LFIFLIFLCLFEKKKRIINFNPAAYLSMLGGLFFMAYKDGRAEKAWFLYVFFLFQLSFLNLYVVVAVVSKIDSGSTVYQCNVSSFLIFFSFFYIFISDLSAVKKHKKLLFDLFCTVGEKDYVIVLSNQQKSKMYCIHTFLLLPTFFRAYLIIVCRVKLLYHDSQAQGTFWANSLSLFAF